MGDIKEACDLAAGGIVETDKEKKNALTAQANELLRKAWPPKDRRSPTSLIDLLGVVARHGRV
jgi:hypothetical protein